MCSFPNIRSGLYAFDQNIHPAKDEEFVFISGSFESSSCEDWLPKIDYGNTEFNSRECLNNEPLQTGENKKIAIKSINKGDDNKSKLSGGQIAGIVVGCVASVAIIVIVIVIIIRKKNKNNSNNENDNVEVNL
ncbi:hypothetical protein M9Y10_035683 [Tritrichomonas musculus]|uniref:Uncharacterized protein n=1 Tax=Tritrichomonas musculus TaxID=1915356 RepID=A0ABR2GX81_9EUKA